ncbi:MAG TPA: FAD-binding oxidoreductase [Polyangiaceae bacterium]|nr:FAD-binding oxidoreductase [Polyangiaceae bacterium]
MNLDQALKELAPRAKVSQSPADLAAYAGDLWPRGLVQLQQDTRSERAPLGVVWPESAVEVARILQFARDEGLEIVPFGAGSGVAGGILPGARSLVLDMKRLSDFGVEAGPTLNVGAGALGITLEERLLEQGFTTGHYPSSILCSTVGGWVAARGIGQCSGRYGKIEDMVTRLEVVLSDGEVVELHSRQRGPDLVPLFVGSEGTLGMITRVGLRLHAAPPARAFDAYSFPNIEAGVTALRRIYQSGHRPAVARLYDPLDTWLLKDDEPTSTPRGQFAARRRDLAGRALRLALHAPALLTRSVFGAERCGFGRVALVLMHEGSSAEVESAERAVAALCREAGGRALGQGPARAWYKHRYHVSYRQSAMFRAGVFVDTMEVSAPWSRIPDVYRSVREAFAPHALIMAHFSHSYPDGSSIYFTFAGTAHGGRSALQVYDDAWRAGLTAALGAGATLSHHHGIGRSKAARMPEAIGAQLAAQRLLKRALDPNGLFNVGAVLPVPGVSATVTEPSSPAAESELPLWDPHSYLVELPARWTLRQAQEYLAAKSHRLPISMSEISAGGRKLDLDATLESWVGLGLPGTPDRFSDPNGARLQSFRAQLRNGMKIASSPAPRRAVGPDLSALFIGTRGAFGALETLTLYAPPLLASEPPIMPFLGDRNPPLNAGEQSLLARLERTYAAGGAPRSGPTGDLPG